MSRRIELPGREQVEATVRALSDSTSGSALTVSALAQHLNLTNSTFWRYFPDIAQSVADKRRLSLRGEAKPSPTPATRKDCPERHLRQQIDALKSQLSIAAAQVQRLTLENAALRRQLEAENTIVRIRDR